MHHGDVSPQIAKGLIALQKRIKAAKIPSSKLDETINVAIWNIREFGKKNRTDAAIHYIAEILGQFDLVALVELRSNLEDLGRTMKYLGPYWDVVYSDWQDDAGGNSERVAFLYDNRAIVFNGLAAEIDAPRMLQGHQYLSASSFWRAPYLCSFRAGNFDFLAIATHTRWGYSIKARKAELQLLADWIDRRFKNKYIEDHDLIVMGDFNVPKIGDTLFRALTSRGLSIPQPLTTLKSGNTVLNGTNIRKNARYDQILHLPTDEKRFRGAGGTLDFFIDNKHIDELFPNEGLSTEKFTFQLSDHFPVWVQINTNIEGQRLDQIVQKSSAGR